MYNKKYNKDNSFLKLQDNLYCEYCGKQCKNLNSLKQHECRCKNNPDKKACTLSNRGWRKGLTKEYDERLKKQSESQKKYYKTHSGAFTGKHHTEETKKILSEKLIAHNHSSQNRNSHGKRGYYDNIFFMSTWELAYYIYIRDNAKFNNISRCTDRFIYYIDDKPHYYTPDFILNDNVYIEIKGRETDRDLIKYKSVDNLKVLYYKDIKHMIKYVKNTYMVEDISSLYVAG